MQLSNWIPKWIDNKNLRIRGILGYFVLTEAQVTAWQPRFFCLPCGCFSSTPYSQRTEPLPNEIDTPLGWQTARTSWAALAPTVRLRRAHLCHHQCRSGCHPGIQWQRCQASLQEPCWYIFGSLLVRLLDQKASLGTQSDRIESRRGFLLVPFADSYLVVCTA